MVGVDKIGEIRRAYFEQERPIKEIVRTLSVSRATVRKIIRGPQTEFKYARDVQPTPKTRSTRLKKRPLARARMHGDAKMGFSRAPFRR